MSWCGARAGGWWCGCGADTCPPACAAKLTMRTAAANNGPGGLKVALEAALSVLQLREHRAQPEARVELHVVAHKAQRAQPPRLVEAAQR